VHTARFQYVGYDPAKDQAIVQYLGSNTASQVPAKEFMETGSAGYSLCACGVHARARKSSKVCMTWSRHTHGETRNADRAGADGTKYLAKFSRGFA